MKNIRKTNDEKAFLSPRQIGTAVERDPLAYASDPRYIQALEVPRALALLESCVGSLGGRPDYINPALNEAIAILRKVAERELRVAEWVEREGPLAFNGGIYGF